MLDVLWVGLSAKFAKDRSTLLPLDKSTLSGKLIYEVESYLHQYIFGKINLVSFPPLDKNLKLRYPTIKECDQEFLSFWNDLKIQNPKVVFMLGNKVSQYLVKKLNLQSLDNGIYLSNNIYFVAIEHPSYIMVYKRKFKQDYINKINQIIFKFCVK